MLFQVEVDSDFDSDSDVDATLRRMYFVIS